MHQVSYTSTRGEVWRWYWRAWARPLGLWRFHALISLAVPAAWATRHTGESFDFARFAGAFALTFAACLLLFPLWPQLRFKPQRRILTIDSMGWTTQVGNLHGSRSWAAVRSVEDRPDAITLVSSNGHALIVPNRAFSGKRPVSAVLTATRRGCARTAC